MTKRAGRVNFSLAPLIYKNASALPTRNYFWIAIKSKKGDFGEIDYVFSVRRAAFG